MSAANPDKNLPNRKIPTQNSIYNYLKKTPSVGIAFASTIVAIVTFFAKLVTLISARKELAFWEFDPSYATFGEDSLVYTVIISILFSFFTTLSAMWFSPACEAYLKQKRFYLTVKYYKKSKSKKIKKIKKGIKSGKASNSDKEYLEDYNKMCESATRVKLDSGKDFFVNLLPVLVVSCFSSVLFSIVSVSKINSDSWLLAIACFAVHLIMLWLLKTITKSTIINKKELKENSTYVHFIEKQKEACNPEEYPLNNLFYNGIGAVLKNSTIILVTLMILANCIILCVSHSMTETDPIKTMENFQLVTIDGTQYGIVYQNGNQYFLEEAEFNENSTDNIDVPKNLTIYTNRQRVLITEDITISVYEVDKIVKEHKNEAS